MLSRSLVVPILPFGAKRLEGEVAVAPIRCEGRRGSKNHSDEFDLQDLVRPRAAGRGDFHRVALALADQGARDGRRE